MPNRYETLKKHYDDYLSELRAVLNRHDPIDLISIGCPADEYDPERSDVAPKLLRCASVDAVLEMTHDLFCRWFTSGVAGPRNRYRALAADLWHLRQRHGVLSHAQQ